jgi:hypothetical protein
MSYFISHLPYDLVCHIRDYVLSVDVKLELLYQKYNIDEAFIKKRLKIFNSEQLENINWKYLYYKIYNKSPPMSENLYLAPIFKYIPCEHITYENESLNFKIRIAKYKLNCICIDKYRLNYAITRSDYYSDKVRTEIGRKRQQNCNIIRAWFFIKNARWSSKIYEFDLYMCNVEYELLRALIVLYDDWIKKEKLNKMLKKRWKNVNNIVEFYS